MSKAIVITSGKGGVGKTTASANIACALAMYGKKVVAVDADIGLRNLDVALGCEKDIIYNLVDVCEKKCRLRQALVKDKRFDELYLLAASQIKDKTSVTPHQTSVIVAELKKSFDYVIIDCPAGIEHGFRNALAGADEALIVTTPDVAAIRDADRVLSLLRQNGLNDICLIINKVRYDMMKNGEMISVDDIKDILGLELLGIIPEGKDAVIAANKGEPVALDYESLAGQAYRNAARRIMGENVEFISFDEKKGLIAKIKNMIFGEVHA